jgi:7-keto-8-aminopelargonate synthetase-like enzyme
MRRRLIFNTCRVKAALRERGFALPDGPGPIVPILPKSPRAGDELRRRLLARGIHPPFIRYPGGPSQGYLRFVISSEHTLGQLDALVAALVRSSSHA